jgi:hypothetical protein
MRLFYCKYPKHFCFFFKISISNTELYELLNRPIKKIQEENEVTVVTNLIKKHFSLSKMLRTNKLECLLLARLFSLVLYLK